MSRGVFLAQRFITETQTGDDAGTEILDEHVGRPHELHDDFLRFRLLEIQSDGFLAGVEHEKRRAHALLLQCRITQALSRAVALTILDLDDLGAEIAERLRAVRA